MAYAIDLNTFQTRLKLFYKHWDEHRTILWGSSGAVSVACPSLSEDLRCMQSSAIFLWLLGYEFPETITVFTKRQIHIMCSQKKAYILESVKKSAKESVGVEIVLHVKARIDDGASLMDAIICSIRARSNSVVGYIAREEPEGKLIVAWDEKLRNSKIVLSDVANGFSALFAEKSSEEVMFIKRAAYLTASVMENFVVLKLENVIDNEKRILHSALMEETEK